MRMTIPQFFEMLDRHETPEEYERRLKRLRRYVNEHDDLTAAIEVLSEPSDAEKRAKKEARLKVVLAHIQQNL